MLQFNQSHNLIKQNNPYTTKIFITKHLFIHIQIYTVDPRDTDKLNHFLEFRRD